MRFLSLVPRFFKWYVHAIKYEMFAKFEFDPSKTYSVDPYLQWQIKTSIGYFKFMIVALPVILLIIFFFR
ncbi:MAG: hypothetical protein A3J46_00430 [Candidatus Yanofskybacteria bacterium RIFCSPHIGHO2_02_FULL_41_11]|uniref:Uncharacterized protein n=1 Tax=Candidatus Yanofskybacteria bacterium RIFCSPHIGHO2_02_FULL_41_11 TaxID=1802675 RepID=A0A1F8FC55_9BACT|nr:MAG: hypothetical protein A3J46_00430 [Candidatus Yanofskybacteria bacterium RIFCSPHIGHO2_02_FULL_41_11]